MPTQIMTAATRARIETTILLLEDNGTISAEAAAAAIRNLGPQVDLENDLHPLNNSVDPGEDLAYMRIHGIEVARTVWCGVLVFCDEEYREEMRADFSVYTDYGMHEDDCDNVLPDPMALDAVY